MYAEGYLEGIIALYPADSMAAHTYEVSSRFSAATTFSLSLAKKPHALGLQASGHISLGAELRAARHRYRRCPAAGGPLCQQAALA